jgi:predicted dehydrogenase
MALPAKQGFGLVGAGVFGMRHAQAYGRHPLVDFVAVCDLDGERAKAAATQYGARFHTSRLADLLDNPDITAISVVTPDNAHREIASACAKAGKHILVEKPLATSVADAEAIVQAAQDAHVILMVDFHNRANPPYASARDAIRRGDIGTPTYIYARLSNTTTIPMEMLRWAGNSSALWFLGSHVIDLACWMLDDTPRKVYAVSREGILHGLGVSAPDFHVATVEFRKGAVAVFENAWILPRTHATGKDMKFEVLGSSGAIYVDTSHNRALEIYSREKASFPDLLAPPMGEHMTGFILDSIAHFIDAVTLGKPVLASGTDGVLNTRIIRAIMESVESGAPVIMGLGTE